MLYAFESTAGGHRRHSWRNAAALILAVPVILALATITTPAHAQPSRLGSPEKPSANPADLVAPTVMARTGFYAGEQAGYGFGSARNTLSATAPIRTTDTYRSVIGGFQLGYDYQLPSRVLVGLQGDIVFPYFVDDGVVAKHTTTTGTVTGKVDFVSTLRSRLGLVYDPWLVYATGGFAWGQSRFREDAAAIGAQPQALRMRSGWSLGAGTELAMTPTWSFKLEYLFDHLGYAAGAFPSGTVNQSMSLDIHNIILGLNWHFGQANNAKAPDAARPIAASCAPDGSWLLDPADWNVHGQLTVVGQGYFKFHSPYEGANSLSGAGQLKHTISTTGFLGVRLWNTGELYFDPEIDQGFGLNDTIGLASFPNGEAQKAAYPDPRFNVDRVFLRQVFGLGGELETLRDGPNQLPSSYDVSRLTVTVGRMSVGDLFFLNSYATDPRTQFMSWNIYGSGSYDWTMDRPGWTWGGVVDFNQKRWALRAGYFLATVESNSDSYDPHVLARGQYTAESEVRYALLSRSGKLRLFGWLGRANMGSYADSLAIASGPPSLAQSRRIRTNYGFIANVEQAVTDELGVFSRATWSPGKVEVMGWTDCDESLSLGAALKGTAWLRGDDTLGLAGVIEGLSDEARAYFAAGGMGILIGDGRLAYAPEEVLEAYYSLMVVKNVSLTMDYQFFNHPAYNANRGPVSIYAARLHAEI